MLEIRNVVTIARFEMRRAIFSAGGGVAGAAFLILCVGPAILRGLHITDDQVPVAQRERVLETMRIYNMTVAQNLSQCPSALLMFGLLSLLFMPTITLLLSHDGLGRVVAGERGRLVVVRTGCVSLTLGSCVGAWLAFGLLCASSAFGLAAFECWFRRGPVSVVLDWTLRLTLVQLFVALAYLGLWTLLGALTKSARLSLVLGLVTAALLGYMRLIARNVSPEVSRWFPGAIDELLLSGKSNYLARALAYGVVLWLAGLWCAAVSLRRRSF